MNKVSIFLVFGLVAALVTSCGDPITINKKIVTGEVSHISCRNAVISGKASIKETASTDLTFGVLYSTNSGVLIGTATQIQATSFDSDYNFSVFTEVLEPEMTYYYRSFISQNGEITYGDTKSFTTLPLSSMIQTLDATDINACEATLNARLDLTDCGYTSFSYGFIIYRQGEQFDWYNCTSGDTGNQFYSRKTGALSREQDYEFAAYLYIDDRLYIADKKPFTTQSFKAAISIDNATNITELRATVTGQLIIESDWAYRTVGVYYHDHPGSIEDLKKNGKRAYGTFDENGLFTTSLSGLEPGKVYYYMAVATVYDYYEYRQGDGSGVSFSSDVKTFSTASIDVRVVATEATNITEFKGTLNGTLTVTSIESVSKEVWFYYSATATTADNLKTQGTKVTSSLGNNGSFSKQITGLSSNTRYFYIACARVNGQEYYSEVNVFTTIQYSVAVWYDVPSLSYTTASLKGTVSINSIEPIIPTEVYIMYSESYLSIASLASNGTKIPATLSGNTFTADLIGLKAGTEYHYVACVRISVGGYDRVFFDNSTSWSFFTSNYPAGTVDMGLSVLWHQCNVGASRPEDYGDYYAWGETTTKSNYDWLTYTLCQGSYSTMTKYCVSSSYGSVDNKTSLEKSDDVASKKLGGKWRMPTDAEWTELRNTGNCTWTWTKENGVNGYRVTSKKTGNSIFLPAAGRRDEDGLNGAGSYGGYWSSSLYTDSSYRAWNVYFGSSNVDRYHYYGRCHGLSVRPVCD